ncbi:hypothetical protein E1295_37580 [Nonomuraea mesophila]|uniref:Trypsin-co-occurring domain-containing protein n=1 Tax=Nonomuraea mesophila TaxID=2530382 RepID=A0A4R5EHW7_9ACTN|nr:CU044_2847 family protein [Nonomuraea mesophila]TDE33883.1 hypothetical protein E1295_37580 [Nonomuraea mesophila]
MLIPAEIGGVPVLIEAVAGPGREPTSRGERRTELLEDMFARAQTVIESIALSAMDVRKKLASHVIPPDQVEVQFGVKFSTQGQIVIASAGMEASLAVKLIFNGPAIVDDDDTSSTNYPDSKGG